MIRRNSAPVDQDLNQKFLPVAGQDSSQPNEDRPLNKHIRVLMIEDSEDEMILILRELKRAGYEVHCHRVETEDELRWASAWSEWDVVIADYSLPKYDGLSALRLIRGLGLDIPLILVSGRIGEVSSPILPDTRMRGMSRPSPRISLSAESPSYLGRE